MRNEKPTSGATPAAVYLLVAALLAWYFLTAVTATIHKSVMFDEMFHLTGGYTYWERGDFRMQPENGNLPQRWDALPLIFRSVKPPKFEGEMWWHSTTPKVGYDFLYKEGNHVEPMLLCGRAMNALFGVAVGLLIFVASKSYFGIRGALVSLALFAFCPTMLANGAMITSDMAAALFFFATALCLWRVLRFVSWQTVLVSGLVMGGLFVAKFGAFMIIPIGLLLAAVQIISPRAIVVSWAGRSWQIQRRGGRILAQLALILVHAAIVWVVIWAFYDFRFSMFATTTTHLTEHGGQITVDAPFARWSEILGENGVVERFIRAALPWHFLPEAYLYGFAFTWHFGKARACFLNGMVGSTGWPSFFPYCVLVKTPPTLFVLAILSAIWLARSWLGAGDAQARWRAIADSLYRSAPLWALFGVYWAFAISSHLNIGHRHILPIYPVMLVFAGGASYWFSRREAGEGANAAADPAQPGIVARITNWTQQRRWPAAAILVLICMGSFLGESLWSWPNYVTYFNQFAGGPQHAYRHLVDSSLDWGQDLPSLKKWLSDVGLDGSTQSRAYLSYFGTGSPAYYGITATMLPSYFEWGPPTLPEPLQPGTYCISATMVQNIYAEFYGHWSNKYEAIYRGLRERVDLYLNSNQAARAKLVASMGNRYWIDAFRGYQQARFARLTSYLRGREPDYEINNSILIYYLTEEQLHAALEEPLPEMMNSP